MSPYLAKTDKVRVSGSPVLRRDSMGGHWTSHMEDPRRYVWQQTAPRLVWERVFVRAHDTRPAPPTEPATAKIVRRAHTRFTTRYTVLT
ncbi:hypothetical protein BaRGS_00022553 [Batillaria attramentaria]|uniref:Uncharacterized protein n=1 Tax=Batillaria attramentaria TaxID=370345 RepID=A0ABD0KGW5_9CAEN